MLADPGTIESCLFHWRGALKFSDLKICFAGNQVWQWAWTITLNWLQEIPSSSLYSRTLIRRPQFDRENSGLELLSRIVSLLRVHAYKGKANGPPKKWSSLPRWSSYQGGLRARFHCNTFTFYHYVHHSLPCQSSHLQHHIIILWKLYMLHWPGHAFSLHGCISYSISR